MSLMTRKEAIDYLHISERTMCQLTAERQISYIQYTPGGKMFFQQADLDAWIASKRIPSIQERASKLSLPGGTFRKRRTAG